MANRRKKKKQNSKYATVSRKNNVTEVTAVSPDTGVIGNKIIKQTEDAIREVETGKDIVDIADIAENVNPVEPVDPEYYDEPDAIEYYDDADEFPEPFDEPDDPKLIEAVRSFDTTDIINLDLSDVEMQNVDLLTEPVQTDDISENVFDVQSAVVPEEVFAVQPDKNDNSDCSQQDQELNKTVRNNNFGHAFIKAVAMVFVFVFTFALALCTGAGLALWDIDVSPSEFMHIMTSEHAGTVEVNASEQNVEDISDDDNSDIQDTESQAVDNPDDVDTNDSEMNLSDEDNSEEADTTSKTNEEYSAFEADMLQTGMLEMSGIDTVVEAVTGDEIEVSEGGLISTLYNALPDDFVSPDTYYPLPMTEVDWNYFNDALFIGDSRMQGFAMYSGLPSTFYTAVGFQLYNYEKTPLVATTNGKVPIMQGIPYNAFSKIYIKVGLNELGMNETKFEEIYAELISKLREAEPRAVIYIQAVLPVTAAKSSSDAAHSNPKITARNDALRAFAETQQCYFIDMNSVISTADGSLMPDMTGDGIHLKAQYMDIWKEYLRTHAVVVP